MTPAILRYKLWILALLLCAMIPVLMFSEENANDRLQSVLERMQKTSQTFQSFIAHITTQKYTAILDLFDLPEKGTFYYQRDKDGSALIRWEITEGGNRILTIRKDEAILYQPKIKSAQKYKLGKNRDKAEYLALGIGQSPANLEKTFDIKYVGSEKVNGSDCSMIELKPKDPEAAAMFSSIIVWVKDTTGVSTKMKLIEPYKDYLIVEFSEEKLNEKIDASIFKQKLPDSVDVLNVN